MHCFSFAYFVDRLLACLLYSAKDLFKMHQIKTVFSTKQQVFLMHC